MKIAAKIAWYFALFWVLILCGGTFLQYYDFKSNSTFLQIKQAAIKTGWYLPAFYSHIVASSMILLAGFFQFSEKVYSNKRLHRLLGKIYVLGVLLFAAPGAAVMTFFIGRGPWVTVSFILQNTLWFVFTLIAWLAIKKGDIDQHIAMMRRSYALAFGAVMLRLYVFLFTMAGVGVAFPNNYLIIAFASWLPNLIVAEVINRYASVRAGKML